MKIIIIGAGPGGYETAVEAAKRGIEVVLVSDGPLGGTCLNEGCIPTKTFCHYAEIVEEFARACSRDIVSGGLEWHFSRIAERKNEVVAQLQAGIAQLLRHRLITVVTGRASFKDAHTVLVNGEEYSGDKVIIATGSVSSSLPIPGVDLPGVVSSREILDFTGVPERLVVIGGGVIGLEFASIYRSFGSQVTVLEYAPNILPRFDVDLSKRLKQALVKRGIVIETSSQVTGIYSGDGSTLEVAFTKKDIQHTVQADKVLMAVGRRAHVESLNLSDIGVEYTRRGVVVDSNMQTSVPDVYAVGDITGGMMLAHVATYQGLRVLNHICAEPDSIRLDVVPAAVFTLPEAATVGLAEEEAKAAGIPIKCLKAQFRANGKAVSMDDCEGYCKVIVATEPSEDGLPAGRILGCHMFGPHCSDLIHEISALICSGSTIDALHDMIHAHPTLAEVIKSVA